MRIAIGTSQGGRINIGAAQAAAAAGSMQELAGSIAATGTVIGVLAMDHVVSAAVAGSSVVTGAVGVPVAIAASVQGTATVTAVLPVITEILSYFDIIGTSTISGYTGMELRIAASVSAQSTVTVERMQYKPAAYVPPQVLMEPYPVPMLWQYRQQGLSLEEALDMWAERLSQWSEEHMTRVMRELSRMGQEMEMDWIDT